MTSYENIKEEVQVLKVMKAAELFNDILPGRTSTLDKTQKSGSLKQLDVY